MKYNAYLLSRDTPHYRRDAFTDGLEAAGCRVVQRPAPSKPSPNDLLVIWNRYSATHGLARRFEAAGAPVIVTENGYLPLRGTKKSFAFALNHHNGAGRWPTDDQRRMDRLDINVEPWRGDGRRGDILILPQRGFGEPGVAMPRAWPDDVERRIRAAGHARGRTVRVRRHPGGDPRAIPLADDLQGVGCAVIWASGAGLYALAAGVPVVYELPQWIGAAGGSFGLASLAHPRLGDRKAAFDAVAQCVWSVEEVTQGEPFRRLLTHHENCILPHAATGR